MGRGGHLRGQLCGYWPLTVLSFEHAVETTILVSAALGLGLGVLGLGGTGEHRGRFSAAAQLPQL